MTIWRDWRNEFLDETLRRHGLGEAFHRPRCATCGKGFKPTTPATVEALSERLDAPEGEEAVDELYRCRVCGEWKDCLNCCLERHRRTPLHRIEVSFLGFLFGCMPTFLLGLEGRLLANYDTPGHGAYLSGWP